MCDNELLMMACRPLAPGTPPLSGHDLEHKLSHAEGWEIEDGSLTKVFQFENHYQAMAFANAVAWISHREDHHPEMTVGYTPAPCATTPTRSVGSRRTISSARPRSIIWWETEPA